MRAAFTVGQVEAEAALCADRYADPRLAHMLYAAARLMRATGTGLVTGESVRVRRKVTITDAAKAAGVSRPTIYHAIHTGGLVAFRENGRPRVWLDEVLAFMRGAR